MSERTNPAMITALTGFFVLGGLLAAGYYGWDHLRKEIAAQNSQTQAVIIELKSGTIDEIRAAKDAAIAEIKTMNQEIAAGLGKAGAGAQGMAGGASAEMMSAVTELKDAVTAISEKQSLIVERLDKLADMPPKVQAKAPVPDAMKAPVVFGPLAKTIYFPLGSAHGARPDSQLSKIVPGLRERITDASCKVNVSGFADTLGNDESNLRLSQKRAEYIAGKLKTQGFPIGVVRGWGERRLKVHTLDGTNNPSNRRVVVEMKCGVPTV